MAKAAKRPTAVLSLTANWQRAFIAATLIYFLSSVALILHTYTHYGRIGAGTWTYQIVTWAYPIASAVVGLLFAMRRNQRWLQRVFWALFLTTLSSMAVNIVLLAENQIRSANNWFYTGNSPSYWLAFGWDWLLMGICFVLYCTGLWWISRRKYA